ncbi:MAG TPA: hypothetical protein VLM37_13180, partial [Fibrobacteraceae bacterium]|nr:hypothetical protein [Fibrobacteraceae bacterium]
MTYNLVKKVGGVVLTLSASIFAQDFTSLQESSEPPAATESSMEPAVSESYSTPAPEAFTPSSPAAPVYTPPPAAAPVLSSSSSAVNFDVLRGNAYGRGAFGNQAGAFVVDDYVFGWPHLMNGAKFVYIEPTTTDDPKSVSGTVAAPLNGMTLFGNLQDASSGSLGVFTVGLAGSGWGANLRIGKDKTYTSTKSTGSDSYETTTTGQGDLVGLNASMLVGPGVLGLNLNWLTTASEYVSDDEEQSYEDLNVVVKYSNFPSATSLFWTAGLIVDLNDEVVTSNPGDTDESKAVGDSSGTGFGAF